MRFWANDELLLAMGVDFGAVDAGLVVVEEDEEAGLAAPAFPKKLIIEDLTGAFDFDAAAVVAGGADGVLSTGAGVAEEIDGDTDDVGLAAGAAGFVAKAPLGFEAGAKAPRLADFETVISLFWTILYILMSLPFCIWVASALETDKSDRSFRGEGSRL